MKIYLANGLFSMADFHFNQLIAEKVREAYPEVDLFLPQESEINDKNSYANSQDIFLTDYNALKESDLVIAVIDGIEIDSGVACEIGIANALGIPVIGLYTDVRQLGTGNTKKINALIEDSVENQFMYRNLFVVGAIKQNGEVLSTLEDLVESIKKYK